MLTSLVELSTLLFKNIHIVCRHLLTLASKSVEHSLHIYSNKLECVSILEELLKESQSTRFDSEI